MGAKYKRKSIKKKINQKDEGEFAVSMNGFQWIKDSMEDAKQFVIDQTESFLSMLGYLVKAEMVNG